MLTPTINHNRLGAQVFGDIFYSRCIEKSKHRFFADHVPSFQDCYLSGHDLQRSGVCSFENLV